MKHLRSQELFHHDRLSSPRSIRILTLFPSQEFSSGLEATLTEVSLDSISRSNDVYEALSYVWGVSIGTEEIHCDGKPLLITPNCDSALRHLRLQDTARALWVDAICIDQGQSATSVEERNAQVALMGEIYQKAACTLCWFGEGTDYTNELIEHLGLIGSRPSRRGLNNYLMFDEQLRRDGRLDVDCSALNYLFCQPWHSRIWTVQEVAFSRHCQVVCGKATLSWEIYCAAAQFLIFDNEIEQLDSQAHKSWISIDMRNTIRDYLYRPPALISDLHLEDAEDEQDRTVTFLSSCLTDVIQLQATEARDKIYGLQALYNNIGIRLPAANYAKSVSRVYEDAAIAMILWSGTLKVLGDAYHIDRSTEFPSWVPDWSDNSIKIYTPSGAATDYSRISRRALEILNPTTGELHVQGLLVGKVSPWKYGRAATACFPTHPEQCILPILRSKIDGLLEDIEFTRLWITKMRFFRQLYSSLQTYKQYYEEDPDDIFLDLLKQSSYSERSNEFNIWLDILRYPETKCNLSYGESLVEKWKASAVSTADRWNVELTNCAVIMASLLTNSIERADQSYDSSGILALLSEFSTNLADKKLTLVQLHSLGITVLGTCFTSVETEDAVVLLKGADWPVILRSDGRRWRFIGPAFVTGIMDGQAWVTKNELPARLNSYIVV